MWRRDISLGTDGAVLKSSVREEKETRLLLKSLNILAFFVGRFFPGSSERFRRQKCHIRTCANLVAKKKAASGVVSVPAALSSTAERL